MFRGGFCLLGIISTFSFQSLSAGYESKVVVQNLSSSDDPTLIGLPLGLTFQNVNTTGDFLIGIQHSPVLPPAAPLSSVKRWLRNGTATNADVRIEPPFGHGTATTTLGNTLASPDFASLGVNHIIATTLGNIMGYNNVNGVTEATPLIDIDEQFPNTYYFGVASGRIGGTSDGVVVATDIMGGYLDFYVPVEKKLVSLGRFLDDKEVKCDYFPVAIEPLWTRWETKKNDTDEFNAENCHCEKKDKCGKTPIFAVLYTKVDQANQHLIPSNKAFVRFYRFTICKGKIKAERIRDVQLKGECIVPTSLTFVPRNANLGLDHRLSMVVMQNESNEESLVPNLSANLVAYNLDREGEKHTRLDFHKDFNTGWQVRYSKDPDGTSALYFTAAGDGMGQLIRVGFTPVP